MSNLTPPLKWHGGKHYLARQIVGMMPGHTHYVEPYAGGLAVLLAKDPEGVSEVANDANGWLTNFWYVLRDPSLFEGLSRRLQATPFCETFFDDSQQIVQGRKPVDLDPIEAATAFFVLCRQSMAGRMAALSPLSRNRTRRGRNEQVSSWQTAIEGLPEVHARLLRIVVLNHDAIDVIREQDGEKTLFYLDPPYLQETRAAKAAYGEYEMTEEQHRELLRIIRECKGKVMLSGYRSALYDSELMPHGWSRVEFERPNSAASGDTKRIMTECIWTNFEISSQLKEVA